MIHTKRLIMYLTVFSPVQSPSTISVALHSCGKALTVYMYFLIPLISDHMLWLQGSQELSAICQGFRDINNL